MNDIPSWSMKGELALNCSCDLFCPCVVSLGAAPPTQGYCQTWLAVRIDEGHFGEAPLSGLNVAMLIDIPGRMGEGNWTAAGYFDERATSEQFAALEAIFTGRARGTTGLFRLLVGTYLGSRREPVEYITDGKARRVVVPKIITAEVAPIDGARPDEHVVISNTQYWMGPEVIVAQAGKAKVRDFGRVWNFDNKSAELCEIDWSGP